PAAACGVVGLKPTLGEVSTEGVVPLSRTLDHVGPLAATVADAHIVYRVLLGDTSPRPAVAAPVAGLRIAVLRRYFCEILDEEVRARFEEGLERLRAAGAKIRDAEIRHAPELAAIYVHIALADAAAYHAPTLEACPD